jgi:hypothetical protein
MKTVDDYLHDPRITGDPEMTGTLPLIRELHAIRLKQHDETAGMTCEQYCNYVHNKAAAFYAMYGIVPIRSTVEAGDGKFQITTK